MANALSDETESANLNLDYLELIGVADRLNDWRDTAAELRSEQMA